MGGKFLLPVSAQVREGAKIAAGDEAEVELDTEAREVSVPGDLAAALDREPDARKAFGRMPYSHQLRYVTTVEDAKTPETGGGASKRRSARCSTAERRAPPGRRARRGQPRRVILNSY